jgi:hypothetical protein
MQSIDRFAGRAWATAPGPALYGLLHDAFGSYDLALIGAAGLDVAAAVSSSQAAANRRLRNFRFAGRSGIMCRVTMEQCNGQQRFRGKAEGRRLLRN